MLILAAIGGFYLFCLRDNGNCVKVSVQGEVYGIYSLSKDKVLNIKSGENNENLNRLIIKNGKAFVETASCPDKICSNHRAIFRDGESIICLPNKVVITVMAQEKSDAPDIIS